MEPIWPWPDNYRIATTDMICSLCHPLIYTNFYLSNSNSRNELSIGTKFGDLDWHWTLCHLLSLYHYRSYRTLLFKFSTLLCFLSHPLGGGRLRDYWTKHLTLQLRRQQHAVNSSQQWQHGVWSAGQLITTRCFSRRSTRHTILGCDELTVWRADWHPF